MNDSIREDRELLALSLRGQIYDEALGRLFDCQPAEVARRRAGAIERLADDLGVQRGEDLGAVLKALLEPETWAVIEGGPNRPAGTEFDPETRRSPVAREPAPPELEPHVSRLGDAPAAGEEVAADSGSRTTVAAPRSEVVPTVEAASTASPQSSVATPAGPHPLPPPCPIPPLPRPRQHQTPRHRRRESPRRSPRPASVRAAAAAKAAP